MLRGTDDARAGAAARPGTLHGPGLQVRVAQPVFGEHIARPVVSLLELGRSGQARPDGVGKIFKIDHQFAVLANFAENLRVRGGQWAFFFGAGFDQTATRENHGSDAGEHKYADPTRVHSSTSTESQNFD